MTDDSRPVFAILKNAVLCIFGGWLLASLFPNFDLSFLAFGALLPFFYLLEDSRGWQRFVLPWSALLVFFLVLLYWIPRVLVVYGQLSWLLSVLLYVALSFALSLFYAPAVICFIFARAIRPWCGYALAPFAWVTCDLLRNFWMVNGFPWGSLGYSQINYWWAQMADIGGIYVVTFLVVSVNALLAYAVLYRSALIPACAVAALLVTSALYGLQKQKNRYFPSNLAVGVVQPVIRFDLSRHDMEQKYLSEIPALIRKLAAQGARLVVLPEAPVVFDYYRDRPFAELLGQLAVNEKIALIFNNTTASETGNYYNSMVFIRPDGSSAGRYDKIHLVPFGEYVPAARWLSFVRPLVQEVSNFSPGDQILVADPGGVRVGGFICYEAIFPELVRSFVTEGAQILVNITDDAWYGRTAAAAQHFQMARMRAIETRRYLVRAANSGISAIVDPNGRVKRQLGIFQEGGILAGTRPLGEYTFYARHGNLFAQLCILVLVAGLGAGRLYKLNN